MLIRVAAHKNQDSCIIISSTLLVLLPLNMMIWWAISKWDTLIKIRVLAGRGKWKVCKKIFARKKIFAVHRLGSSWPWSRAGSRAVSGLFHVSLGIIKSALCLLCPPSRRQDTAVEGRQMQVYSSQVYSMSRYISTMEISILQLYIYSVDIQSLDIRSVDT